MSTTTVSAADRLGLTLFISITLHAIIVLGVVFSGSEPVKKNPFPTLDVILAQEESKQAPDEADYLAQANQDGGGNSAQPVRPTRPPPTAASLPIDGRNDIISPPRTAATPRAPQAPRLITRDDPAAPPRPVAAETTPDDEAEIPSAAQLIMRGQEIAQLSAEIEHSFNAYSKIPRQLTITSRSREYRDAAYMEAWRQKVERIGNLNYPDEARRLNLSGHLVMNVALKPDGSIHRVEITHSSGHKALDDAAVRIVHLAAPYAAFPPEIRKDYDIVNITRTWQFLSGNRFASD